MRYNSSGDISGDVAFDELTFALVGTELGVEVDGFEGSGLLEDEKVNASSAGSGLSAGMSWQ